MSTDLDWLRWGRQDPYFAVITNDKYRTSRITAEAKKEFFDSGRHHVNYVLDACRRLVDPAFAPARALDFGCGVGRVTLPLAEKVATVVGVDVSPHMLAEAQRNCAQFGLSNVEYLLSDDELSAVQGPFDLVHSCITFQHIDIPRGRRLFARLIGLLADGGIGAIQITYAKAYHEGSFGQPPAPPPLAAKLVKIGNRGTASARQGARALPDPLTDPEMQMNPYNLSELAYLLQVAGIKGFQAQFTDHGGELGVFLFFKKPATARPAP